MPKQVTCTCPACQRSIAIPAELTLGKRLRCPHCQQIFPWTTPESATRTLEQAPPATATLPPVSTDASHDTGEPNAEANQATLTIDPHRGDVAKPSAAASTPKTISRFEIRRILGEGGFGIVYEGYDPQLDRAIALKVAKRAGDSEHRIKHLAHPFIGAGLGKAGKSSGVGRIV